MQKKIFIIFIALLYTGVSIGQKVDTIKINSTNIQTKALVLGDNQWLVFFKNGKDSCRKDFSIWNRRAELIKYHDKEAIAITQQWESNDTVTHTAYTVCDRKTFVTLFHEIWWKGAGTFIFDYDNKTITRNGKPFGSTLGASEQAKKMFNAFDQATKEYHLNWHIDLETFSLLPYKDNAAFVINFYDPGFDSPKKEIYTVIGSGALPGYNGQKIECWKLAHGSLPKDYEVFWVNKKTREVMKLDQEFDGKFRYKVKLPFSN